MTALIADALQNLKLEQHMFFFFHQPVKIIGLFTEATWRFCFTLYMLCYTVCLSIGLLFGGRQRNGNILLDMKTNKVCTDNKLFPADGERGGYVGGVWQWRPGIQVAEGSDGVAYAIGGKSREVVACKGVGVEGSTELPVR